MRHFYTQWNQALVSLVCVVSWPVWRWGARSPPDFWLQRGSLRVADDHPVLLVCLSPHLTSQWVWRWRWANNEWGAQSQGGGASVPMTLQKVVWLCASFDSTAQGRLHINAARFKYCLLLYCAGLSMSATEQSGLAKLIFMPQLCKSRLKGIVHQKSFLIKCDREPILIGVFNFCFSEPDFSSSFIIIMI